MAIYVDKIYADLPSFYGFDLILAIFLFAIQIYCDFSGYSDIAIGTSKLLDIDLMTNFKSPYFSASVKEFWGRWHVSLSRWFRDYVYIPLGGNQCGKLRHNVNLLMTFFASGLWHGADWTFVAWGFIHGIAQVIENAFERLLKPIRENKIGHVLCVVIVFVFCSIAWVFFRAETFSDAGYVLKHMLDGIGNPVEYIHSSVMSLANLILILIYILILGIYDYLNYTGNAIVKLSSINKIWQWVIYVFIGLMIIFCSQKGAATEFVYFQF